MEKINKKLKLSLELFDFAFQLKKSVLREKFPQLSEKELHKETIRFMHKGVKYE